MGQTTEGTLLLGLDSSDGILIYKSTHSANTWISPTAGVSAVPDPAGVNEHVGNVCPLGLPNDDILIGYRHLNDTDDYDPSPDGIKFFNIEIQKSSDGGTNWNHLSSPLNDPRSPGGGVSADQCDGHDRC